MVALDGVSPLTFTGVPENFYYVVLNHRNHLAVMSLDKVLLTKSLGGRVDFTTGVAYGNEPMHVFSNGTTALFVGDTNDDGSINAADRSNTWNDRNQAGYLGADCDLNCSVNAADRSITWNNRNRFSQVP